MRYPLLCSLLLTACGGLAAPAIDGDGSATYAGLSLSAPLVMDPSAFAPFTDPAAYAKLDADARMALVMEHTHTFDALLTTCAATDPRIVTPTESKTQRDANYAAVATCAYRLYGPTPAWVPQLVGDVNVCETFFGVAWHTPGTAEVAQLLSGVSAALASAIAATGTTEPIYAGLKIYALTLNATPELADLSVDPVRLTPFTVSTTLDTDPIGLRCIHYVE